VDLFFDEKAHVIL